MTSRSVGTLLTSVLVLLAGGVLISTGLRMVEAVGQFRASSEAQTLAAADKTIFEAIRDIRGQRGTAMTALIAEDDPTPKLDALQRTATARYEATRAALAAVDVPGRDDLDQAIAREWGVAESHYPLLLAEAKRPRKERDLKRIAAWQNSRGIFEQLNNASSVVSNRARMSHPLIGEMVQVRRLAWQARDRYGLQCSLLRANVNSGQAASEAQKVTHGQHRAVLASSLAGIDELLARPGAPAAVAASFRTAHGQIDAANAKIDQVTSRLGTGTAPLMPPAEWTAACQAPFDAIVAVAIQALDEAIAQGNRDRAAALTNLVVQSVAFAAALAVALFGWIVVRRRFAAPVRSLLGSIERLRARDYATPVPPPAHQDEFGAMAVALENLRESAATAERLSAEHEAAQQSQLARAGTVDAACESFDSTAKAVIDSLGRSAGELRSTAAAMRTIAGRSSE
ncbi:HAMP domain-containing protein, partial [Rhodoplanes elegans]